MPPLANTETGVIDAFYRAALDLGVTAFFLAILASLSYWFLRAYWLPRQRAADERRAKHEDAEELRRAAEHKRRVEQLDRVRDVVETQHALLGTMSEQTIKQGTAIATVVELLEILRQNHQALVDERTSPNIGTNPFETITVNTRLDGYDDALRELITFLQRSDFSTDAWSQFANHLARIVNTKRPSNSLAIYTHRTLNPDKP